MHHTYAPWGCITRVVSLTKSRRIPTRNMLPLFLVGSRYMNAFQHTLTACPWFPVIGNHKKSDGDHFKHYEAIAYVQPYL